MKTKHLGRFAAILLTVFSGCKTFTVDKSDSLYRRWRLLEVKERTGLWSQATSPFVINFRPDGQILYELTGSPCCLPTKVAREADLLKIKSYYNGPGCETIDCIGVSRLRIVSLNDNQLDLEYIYISGIAPVIHRYKPAQ